MQVDCRLNRVPRIEIAGNFYLNYSGEVLTHQSTLISPIGKVACDEYGHDVGGNLMDEMKGIFFIVSDMYYSYKKFERRDLISVSNFKNLSK